VTTKRTPTEKKADRIAFLETEMRFLFSKPHPGPLVITLYKQHETEWIKLTKFK
jgi:hypothetical protein